MADDSSIAERIGFDLDTAVFFAELSGLAYGDAAAVDAAVRAYGFESSKAFDQGNVQGYWCRGPNVAVLAFRGTSNPGQWLRDVRFFPVAHAWGHVHVGFKTGVEIVEPFLREFDDIARATPHVWVVGHSLGGALALLAAARLKITTGKAPLVHTYGQPAVGLNDFAERCNVELAGCLWRFVNQSDIVTRVPPAPLYRHVGAVKRIVRPGVLESMVAITESLVPANVQQEVVAAQVVAGGAALEAAHAAAQAEVDKPLLTDIDPLQLNDVEFARLQVALGAGAPVEEGPFIEEGIFSMFSDHAISEYVRLLTDIRAQSAGGS